MQPQLGVHNLNEFDLFPSNTSLASTGGGEIIVVTQPNDTLRFVVRAINQAVTSGVFIDCTVGLMQLQ